MTRFVQLSLLFAALLIPHSVAAQSRDWNPQGFLVNRAELSAQLERYEAAATASTYSADMRRQAQREADLIRTRLEHGDFRPGDQIVLRVELEQELSDTFVVSADRTLVLPLIGEIPMDGVLRAELTEHLRKEVARFVRDPSVRAHSLLRLTVIGQIGRAGFFVVPSDALVTEVLTLAGGPSNNAAIDRIRIERAGRVIWDGPTLQENIIGGRTLDQLNLQAGDRIIVPELRSRLHSLRWGFATATSALLLAYRLGLFR